MSADQSGADENLFYDLVLDLHSSASRMAGAQFNDWALERLQTVISFDCAWMGQAIVKPEPTVLAAHLFNIDSSLLTDYQAVADADFFGVAIANHPGRTIIMADLISNDDYYETKLWTDCAHKYQIHAAMGTALFEPRTTLTDFLTIWRADRRWPFSEKDRQFKQRLMPHLIEAKRTSRLFEVRSGQNQTANLPWAICKPAGELLEIGSGFTAALLSQWPQWQSIHLPAEICSAMQAGASFHGQHVTIDFEHHADQVLVLIRKRINVDTLSPREHEVASFYSNGKTYAEIAARLKLAPGTVRKHIERSYSKLGVATKVDLYKALISGD